VWYERQGAAAEVLHVGERPQPPLNAGDVLVRVHASGVNPSDLYGRAGTNAPMPFPLIIPHQDGAGVIEAVGEGVPPARVGERVWVYEATFGRPHGTAAEYTVVPAAHAIPLPDQISFEAGACLGIPAMTAHRCLFADGPLTGKRVLVTGGAGALGETAGQQPGKRGRCLVGEAVGSGEEWELAG
jgi:NADPH2:quinone reductase